VIDQSQAPVFNIEVVISSAAGPPTTVRTDAEGRFTLAALAVGVTYTVTAVKTGFAEAKLTNLALTGGTTADVTLELNVASNRSQITVTGIQGEVRTDGPQLGNRITGRQLEETPTLNRRITFLPLLDSANRPAINQGDVFMNQNLFTTNGAGRRQTWFEIDGSTGNDAWGRQTIFTNLPHAAVQEMTVLSNSFSTEYGGSQGSAVNIVTRTGGDRLRGQIIEVWRPSETAAALSGFTANTAANGNALTSDSLGQTALSVGGPVLPGGRTHFFAAGEYSREDRGSPVTSPIAPGIYVGRYRGWLGFLRLDHKINDQHTVFFRSTLDAFYDTNPNGIVGGNSLPSVARVFRRRTYSQQLGATSVFSPTVLNSIRLQFQLASPITKFDPVVYGTQYQVPISAGGTFTQGTSQSAALRNSQYQASDTLSILHGRQIFKLGGSLIAAHSGGNSKEFGGPIYFGQFIFKTCTAAPAFCESPAYLNDINNVQTYTQSYGNATYKVNDVLGALFFQDDYKVRQDLTVNFGIRYERQTFTDFKNGFAPRIGFSYNVLGDGKTVVRGGFGIYYSQIVDNAAANYALSGPASVFNYTAAPGQIGFPASLQAVPLLAFPAGAQVPVRSLYIRPGDSAYIDQFLPVATLKNYQARLLNPYSEQWTFGLERKLRQGWVLRADYVGSHSLRINRPLDVDSPARFVRTAPGQTRAAQAANCTRPFWIWWYGQNNLTCNPSASTNPQPPYSVILSDVNDGYSYYDALQTNLTGSIGRKLTALVSYTWSHTIDNVDPDVPGQNPNDPNITGKIENGNAVFDQRHRLVMSGVYVGPGGIHLGLVTTIASGLPYNIVTGSNNSGDAGATTDRPVINGVVIGRNAGRGNAVYEVSPLLERPFRVNEHLRIEPRVEFFNIFNHANFVGYSGTYGNGAAPGTGFGSPLSGITSQLPARSLQFSIKISL
jgi:hypothetical protein